MPGALIPGLPPPAGKQDFHPATSFQGSKPGYVFKMDTQGLGYYFDTNSADIWEPFGVSASASQGAVQRIPELASSFGAALLAMAAPDSNRIFVVGRAPLRDAEGEGRRVDADWSRVQVSFACTLGLFSRVDSDWSRVQALVVQLHLNPNAIEVQQFLTLAHRIGHTDLTVAEARTCVVRVGGVAKLEHFFDWHCRQVQSLQLQPLLLRSRNGGTAFERVTVPLQALKWAKSTDSDSAQISRTNSNTSLNSLESSLSLQQQRQLQFVDVAFGGTNNHLGVILGRYGNENRSLLLVTHDAGETWAALCPQRWREQEKIRKEEAERAAERERAARLQEDVAASHKQQADDARRRKEARDEEEGSRINSPETGRRRRTTGGDAKENTFSAKETSSSTASAASTKAQSSKTSSKSASKAGSHGGSHASSHGGSKQNSRPGSPGKDRGDSTLSGDKVGSMMKFAQVKKEKKADNLDDSLGFGASGMPGLVGLFCLYTRSLLPIY